MPVISDIFDGMTEEEILACFEESFYDDLYSWFSADLICCDNCYDKFVAQWPAAYFKNSDFQCGGMDLRFFYSGSRLQDFFTEQQFNKYIKKLICPKCGAELGGNIWVYRQS